MSANSPQLPLIRTKLHRPPVAAVHYVRNPALNTEANHSWVLALRARVHF